MPRAKVPRSTFRASSRSDGENLQGASAVCQPVVESKFELRCKILRVKLPTRAPTYREHTCTRMQLHGGGAFPFLIGSSNCRRFKGHDSRGTGKA